MIFYLSGAMEFKEDLGKEWREWLTEKLEELRHDTINPVRLESPEEAEEEDPSSIQDRFAQMKLEGDLGGVRKAVRKFLFRKDVFGIQLADAVFIFYDEAALRGAGTISEAWESFREGKPIYLVTNFSPEKIPAWLIGETTAVFKNFDEFLDYVKDHNVIIRDIMKAQKVRDEVLGGIYTREVNFAARSAQRP